jgi:hypothetical protein
MLKHVVMMKFKPGIREAEIEGVERGLGALPSVIPEILSYEFGRDVVCSERSYDFGLVSEFIDLDSLQRYQRHPDHLVVVDKLKQICASILAVDFHTARDKA